MTKSKADEVLKRIERMSSKRYLPIIGPDRGRILVNLIRRFRPKRVLEVGTLVGYSTILMAKELEVDAEITTIEIDEDEAKVAEDNISKAMVKPKVEVLIGDALDIIPNLKGKYDLVFLDASKEECLDYLKLVEDKLHRGSVVVADNATSHAMRDYLKYVRKTGKYESQFIPVGWDGVEVSIKTC